MVWKGNFLKGLSNFNSDVNASMRVNKELNETCKVGVDVRQDKVISS